MPIEILGWIIKRELSIGDIAAIVALILSPLIFVVGYMRARRADDVKTVSDLMNKIEKASTEIIIFRENHLYPPDIKTESENIWLLQYRRLLVGFQLNLRYLTHLVRNKDIKTKHLVNYCRYDAIHYLGQLNQHYIRLERDYSEFPKKEIIGAGFHEEVLDLEEFWKDIGISRWHKIFRYKKRKAN